MINKVYIYFDTEFTSFESPKLLSLGAVSSTLAEFYAEAENFSIDECSDFVKQNVLTKFTGPSFSLDVISIKFVQWIESFQLNIVLLSDSQYDRDIINALCGYPIPLKSGFKCVWMPLPHSITTNSHHALEDAWGLIKTFGRQYLT